MNAIPALRSAADDNAVRVAHAALAAALKGLDVAYKDVEDARIEEILTAITEALENAQGDLVVLAHQIHDDADADAPLRPWFHRYASAA